MNLLLKIYLDLNLENADFSNYDFCEDYEELETPHYNTEFRAKKVSLPDYILENKDTSFHTLLFKFIDERNLKDSDVYNQVNLDRRLFSKIRSDRTYHPSKETVLLLGLSLKLSEEEMDLLLKSASYALAKNNYFDLILRFCFINHIYDVTEVNTYLDDYNCKLLNC